MSKTTIWCLIAGALALIAIPMVYIGLENDQSGLAMSGMTLFVISMFVTPVTRLLNKG